MILGHYAVALAAKRVAPRASLGTLILAAQLPDLLWPILLLLGVERVRIVPGLMAASALDFTHYPISHSLLAVVAWGVALGLAYYVLRRYGAGAWVLAGLVVSHWMLDAPMHRPDLPLWPGSQTRVGGGLWSSIPATFAIEIGLLAFGVGLYVSATRPRNRRGSWGLWTLLGALVLVLVGGVLGPPPADERVLAVSGLGLWLFVAWGYWLDRHRGRAAGHHPGEEPSTEGRRAQALARSR